MPNDTFHSLKLSPDLIHLQEKGNRQRAKELDRLVTQKMPLGATELPLRAEKRKEPYLVGLLKRFTRDRR